MECVFLTRRGGAGHGRAGMGEAAVVRTGHEQQQPLPISSNTKLVPPATPFLFPSDTEK